MARLSLQIMGERGKIKVSLMAILVRKIMKKEKLALVMGQPPTNYNNLLPFLSILMSIKLVGETIIEDRKTT